MLIGLNLDETWSSYIWFQNFELKMMDSETLKNSIRLKENPFVVPEGYFRKMQERALLARRRRRIGVVVPLLSVAAAVAVLIVGIWTWNLKFDSMPVKNLAQMSDEEIIAYLIYSGVEVEEIEIHEVEYQLD